jgi:hypothetical protein
MQASGTLISPTTGSPHHFAWKVWAERLLLALLLLLFSVRGFIPAWSHLDSDFPNYYLAARLYRQGYPVERVYDWVWFQRQKDHAGIDRPLVGFIPSTPTSALIVLPLSSLLPLQANRCWLLLSLAFLSGAAALLRLTTQLTLRRIGLLIFLAIGPLRDNFLLGQVHTVLLFLLVLAAWLFFEDRYLMSGIVLASAAAMKIYPALFLIFFMLKKQWRAACGLVVGSAGAVVISIYFFGVDACRAYVREVLPWAFRGEITDPYDIRWDSISALLHRLFIAEPELNPSPVAHWPSLYAFLHSLIYGFIFVAFMWALTSKTDDERGRRKLEWAAYLFLLLLVSPLSLSFHFIALTLTVVFVVDYLGAREQGTSACVVTALYALICLPYDRVYSMNPSGWRSLLFFPRLSVMALLGGVLLWILISSSKESLSTRLRSRSALLAASALVTLIVAGFVSNLRHLRGQFDNYATRVATISGSAIATDPAVSSDSLFFTALVPSFSASSTDAYAVHKLTGDAITSYGTGGDWFHPTTTKDGASWAEVATTTGSRIVRFESNNPFAAGTRLPIEADNAEQPVVSFDGALLAYIREVQGRGSLWIRRIGRVGIGEELGTERQLVSEGYAVREAAFFPDHRLVFSSTRDRKFRLYTVDPETGKIAILTDVSCSARYPAISPDGRWMAFSCEQNGDWQLHAMDMTTAQQIQLTDSECNSVSPAWMPNSKDLIYATDCGRGLGITALSKLSVVR